MYKGLFISRSYAILLAVGISGIHSVEIAKARNVCKPLEAEKKFIGYEDLLP